MSLRLRALLQKASPKPNTRAKLLALVPNPVYEDGKTKQSFADETNIEKIMARADRAGTISHLQKFEGVYADYSDFDFAEQTNNLAKGRQIFSELPAELRQEFGQDPDKFFAYVNDPGNKDNLDQLLPGLAAPGKQIIDVANVTPPDDPPVVDPPADPPADPPV